MRATTIRFGEDLWEMLEREAGEQQISTAQLIREAAILRVAGLAARRGDSELEMSVAELADRARRRETAIAARSEIRDAKRLAAVRATGLLDNGGDPSLDRLADAARRVINAPVALVTLIDADRQVFASSPGLKEPWASLGESPLSHSFCAEALSSREPLVIEDARRDPALKHNPAIEEMDVIAYLGAPLVSREEQVVGVLCVIDAKPRSWTRDQVELAETLAAAVIDHIEAQRTLKPAYSVPQG